MLDDDLKEIMTITLAEAASFKGFVNGSWGLRVESPRHVTVIALWSSLDAWSIDFRSNPGYGQFVDRLRAIADPRGVMLHFVPGSKGVPKLHELPVVAVLVAHDIQPGYLSKLERFTTDPLTTKGFINTTYGAFIEDVEGQDGKKGRAAIVLSGWETPEEHRAFARSPEGKVFLGKHKLSEGCASYDTVCSLPQQAKAPFHNLDLRLITIASYPCEPRIIH